MGFEHLKAYDQETDLISAFGEDKAYTIWAMALYLNTGDLMQLAADCLVDGADDHKIDFLQYDEDEKSLIIAQGYHSQKIKESAKANKAADLNAALAWLFNGDIRQFGDEIKPKVEEIRKAFTEGNLLHVELLFVHNCGESKEVEKELKTASDYLANVLNSPQIEITYKELGNPTLENYYLKKIAHISVDAVIECPFPIIYEENSDNWSSAVLSVTGEWLRDLYTQYNTQLFTANYRGYLGEYRNRINKGIRKTAETESKNFWAYNNGITILTTEYESKNDKTLLHGIAIINGAQTTGTLGQIQSEVSLSDVKIMARIIKCNKSELVDSIVMFNNSQNKITAWDAFGNDELQKQIKVEFERLHHNYSIKRGFDNKDSILNIESAIQPLLAFTGRYKDAGRSKSTLFETKTLYSDAFEHVHARHILIVLALYSSLYAIRDEVKVKVKKGQASKTELKINELFQQLRSRYFVTAIIAEVLTKRYPILSDKKAISFTPEYADKEKYPLSELEILIKPVIKRILNYIVAFDRQNPVFTYYNTPNCIVEIADKVESDIASLREDEAIDKVFASFGNMMCNG